MKHSILVVDDEIDNVEALERLFRRKYNVLKATSGAEGLKHLKSEKVALIVTDQRMPNMTGVEFLAASMKLCPDAIRILLTGFTDIESVIGAINSGQVYRYVTKPWDPVDLANTVDKAVERYDLANELKIKNAELKSALDELRVLDQAKSNFMILINHELKTPLTVITSYLELLKETKLTEEQIKFSSRIATASERLHSLIDDSLLLVQAETGLLKAEPSSIKVPKLNEELSEIFSESLGKKKMSLLLTSEMKSFKADGKIVRTVLQRLIDNAIKFGKDGSDVTILIESTADDQVVVKVENEGKSLSASAIQRILKPFALDEDVMNHSKGTGLGLSLSQALLNCHQSKLNIESSDGKFIASFSIPQ